MERVLKDSVEKLADINEDMKRRLTKLEKDISTEVSFEAGTRSRSGSLFILCSEKYDDRCVRSKITYKAKWLFYLYVLSNTRREFGICAKAQEGDLLVA